MTPSSPSGVVGFRLLDLSALAEQGASGRSSAPLKPAELVARRHPSAALEDADPVSWSRESGVGGRAVAERPTAR